MPRPLTLADVSIEWGRPEEPTAVLTGKQVAILLEFAIARWSDYRKPIGADAISECFEHLGEPEQIGVQLLTVAEGLTDIVGLEAEATETAYAMEILTRDALARLAAAVVSPEAFRVTVRREAQA